MKSKFYFLAVILVMFAIFTCCEKPEKIWQNEGRVTTGTASEITSDQVILEGNLADANEIKYTEVGFYYDTIREMFNQKKKVANMGENGTFSTVISDLAPQTTYYYYAFATAYGKTKEGEIGSFKTLQPDPVVNGHKCVDLGLPSGTLWATCNAGAATPESWGSKYPKGSDVTWGGEWRVPTREDFEELLSICSAEAVSMNDEMGIRFNGTNGKYIFLPFNYHNGATIGVEYWTSTPIDRDYYILSYRTTEHINGGVESITLNGLEVKKDWCMGCEYGIRPVCPSQSNK